MSSLSDALRAKHPTFTYHSFSHAWDGTDFILSFHYSLTNGPDFAHQVKFLAVDKGHFARQPDALLKNLFFHLGLIEAFSYWKLAASPNFQITAGSLSSAQIDFWHDLLLSGMGEYFYVNNISYFDQNFLHFSAPTATPSTAGISVKNHSQQRSALNLGGGKDSAVMLAAFRNSATDFVSLIVNPASPAAHQLAADSHHPTHLVSRHFDPQLIELNRQNYLNGHVPFSASLAFINAVAAVLYDYDYAIVGNEKSADECSLTWHDSPINHQYSKSTKFEQSFRTYCSQYLIKNIEYFSFIRPLSELKIAQIFSKYPQYFSTFKSCNRGQQAGQWCENCPKCLFVFLLLSPFIDPAVLTSQIFTHNLLADQSLLPTLKKLVGLTPAKPLECVGTVTESRVAFYLTVQKYHDLHQPLPALLQALETSVLDPQTNWSRLADELLTHFDSHHFLPSWAITLLQAQL